MKRILTLFILAVSAWTVYAQTPEDSVQDWAKPTDYTERLKRENKIVQKQFPKYQLAQRYFNEYKRFKSQHQNDSAAYYIALRAALDTANAQWQKEAAIFMTKLGSEYGDQGRYVEALTSYAKALELYKSAYGERHSEVALSYEDIG